MHDVVHTCMMWCTKPLDMYLQACNSWMILDCHCFLQALIWLLEMTGCSLVLYAVVHMFLQETCRQITLLDWQAKHVAGRYIQRASVFVRQIVGS